MAIFLSCPNGHRLQVKEELAGKKVRCAQCQVIVIVPAADPPSTAIAAEGYQLEAATPPPLPPRAVDTRIQETAPDEGPETPRKKKKKRAQRENAGPTAFGLDMVNTGLRLHYLKIVLVLCVLVSPLVFVVLGLLLSALGLGILIVVLQIAFWGMLIAPAILGLIGSAFCISVPIKAKARPWIIASLALEISWPLLLLVMSLVPTIGLASLATLLRGTGRLQGSVLMLVGTPLYILVIEACVLAPWICFMIFLNKLGDFLDRSDLAHEALSWPVVFIRWGAIVGVALGVFLSVVSLVRIRVDMETARILSGLIQIGSVILYFVGVYFVSKLLFAFLEFLDRFRSALSEKGGDYTSGGPNGGLVSSEPEA